MVFVQLGLVECFDGLHSVCVIGELQETVAFGLSSLGHGVVLVLHNLVTLLKKLPDDRFQLVQLVLVGGRDSVNYDHAVHSVRFFRPRCQ